MVVNRKRRRRAKKSTHRRRVVRVQHLALNRKHRARRRHNPKRRRSYRGGGGGVPAGVGGFISTKFLTSAGMVAFGAVAPSLVTDKLLPMLGLNVTGIVRRAVQFAVPLAVATLGGKRLLGKNLYPFVLGGAGITLLGLVNDFTGALPMLGRYSLPAPQMGRYERTPAVLTSR